MIATRFEYGTTRIKDLRVDGRPSPMGKRETRQVVLDGEPVATTDRFWSSLHLRFGFTSNIFRYFTPAEVFERISTTAANDRIRWCLERDADGQGRLLAVTN